MILSEEDRNLLSRAAAREGGLEELTQDRLADLTRTEGLDFATALLYARILRNRANEEFLKLASSEHASSKPSVDLIGVVPGAFHREHRNTGADGARVLAIADQLGCKAEVIPIPSFGSLDEDAGIILDWLEARQGRRIALISLSKGGADVKRALSLPRAAKAFAAVSAWISFSGMVQGTPLVSWLRKRPLRWLGVCLALWWKGNSIAGLNDLCHESKDDAASEWPAIPPHLKLIHICGFPLRRHIAHEWAGRGYARLSTMGPNDGGGILLADFLRVPGIVCPIWGADHYLKPHWDIMPLLQGIVTAALAADTP